MLLGHLRYSLLQKSGVEIKHAKAPARFVETLTGMRFIWIENYDAAGRRDVLRTSVYKTLCALFDDADRRSLMGMFCEGIRDVARVKELHISQVVSPPDFRTFAVTQRLIATLRWEP